jgi:hypothetical protein
MTEIKHDVVVGIKNVEDEGLNFQVLLTEAQKPDMTNPAHFFGHWLAGNVKWLLPLAMREMELTRALDEAQSPKLKLVDASGERL